MANIVLGIASSHGPSLEESVEQWPRLGERDTRDPRFNFQELLKVAKPGLAGEITPDVQRARHAAGRDALRSLSKIVRDAALDAVIIVSNPHRLVAGNNHPVFGVFRASTFPTERRSDQPFDPDFVFRARAKHTQDEIVDTPGHPELANHLIASLIDDGFDVACTDELPQGATLDDAFAFPRDWLFEGAAIPSVPFLLSRVLPNQATPRRCHELGGAIRRAVASWPADARIGIVASGGLSHQVIDEELDRIVIDALVANDTKTLFNLSRERLNKAPGTPEILNWIAVSGAMAPAKMQLVDYLPCYRSLASTGQGCAFAYWM